MAIYFTSDTHFGHKRVLEFTERPWATIEEMNWALVERINDRVGYKDDLYILGDFSFRLNLVNAQRIRKQIRCKKVHLLPGNHDRDWTNKQVAGTFRVEPPILRLKVPELGGRRLTLSHYPIMDWPGLGHGDIHLHGHIHSTREYNELNRDARMLRYDVGVDANNYAPVSLEEILEFFDDVEHLPRVNWREWAREGATALK